MLLPAGLRVPMIQAAQAVVTTTVRKIRPALIPSNYSLSPKTCVQPFQREPYATNRGTGVSQRVFKRETETASDLRRVWTIVAMHLLIPTGGVTLWGCTSVLSSFTLVQV